MSFRLCVLKAILNSMLMKLQQSGISFPTIMNSGSLCRSNASLL
jgi:hypothetical protein